MGPSFQGCQVRRTISAKVWSVLWALPIATTERRWSRWFLGASASRGEVERRGIEVCVAIIIRDNLSIYGKGWGTYWFNYFS